MTAADFVRRSMNAIMGRRVEQYITVFGWTKADFRTDAQLTRFLEILDHNRISRGSDWTVGFDGEARSLQEAGLDGSRSAILRQNELVAGEAGTLFQTRDGGLSFLLNRTPVDGGWINQITGTASSRVFQTSESAIEYVDFVLSLGEVLNVEYLIAAEAAEERAATTALGLPRYENSPSQGIPYTPWLLVLGQSLAQCLPATLPPSLQARRSGGLLAVVAGATPLDWRSKSSQQSRADLRATLGAHLFRPAARQAEE